MEGRGGEGRGGEGRAGQGRAGQGWGVEGRGVRGGEGGEGRGGEGRGGDCPHFPQTRTFVTAEPSRLVSKKTNVVNCLTKITIGLWQYQIICPRYLS